MIMNELFHNFKLCSLEVLVDVLGVMWLAAVIIRIFSEEFKHWLGSLNRDRNKKRAGRNTGLPSCFYRASE